MAFILEDGTGVVDANALVDIAYFTDYAATRNIDISGYSNAEVEGAIVVASSDYISTYYCFKGEKLNPDQGMSIPTTEVPINRDIKNATCSAALQQITGTLFVETQSSNGVIKSEMDKVSSLETSVEYFENTQRTTTYATPTTDRLLQPYLCTNGGGFGAPTVSLRF